MRRLSTRRLLLLPASLLFTFFPLALVAQEAEPGAKGAGACVWKVEGGERVLHLAGSVHLLREEDHPLPDAYAAAYAASDLLVLEVAMEEDDDAELAALRHGMQKGGRTIAEDLSNEVYAKLRKYLEGSGLAADAMDGFRPWLASMSISLAEMMKLGGRPDLGVDGHFEKLARRDGKPVRGLESSEFQIGLFADLDRDAQELMLRSTLEEMADIEEEFPRLVAAWREGDDKELIRFTRESTRQMPEEFGRRLLDDRNRDWIGKLEKYMEGERDAMVVVGVGHLVGPGGVVELLKERGYEVRRTAAKKPRFIRVLHVPDNAAN